MPLVAALLAVLAAPVAGAEFEGMLETKISVQGSGVASGGTSRIWVSRLGMRMEMEIGAGGQGMKMTTLVLRSKPGLAYMVNDARKTYSEVDTTNSPEASRTEEETYSVRKLGSERIAGFDCTHVLVKGNKGSEFEIWSTKDLGSGSDYWASQRSSRSRSTLAKALQEASADGWPVKSVHRSGSEMATTSELVKAERKAVPASLFDLSGYAKSAETGPGGMSGQMQLSPERQKQVDAARRQQKEALKNMTPEQRKQVEEMMKAGQTGGAPKSN
jgi:Spy/CpxP family protein refolding chaperone